MAHLWLIGIGGFLGALTRYTLMSAFSFLGTSFILAPSFVVNSLGCMVAGLVFPFVQNSSFLLKPLFYIGFLGSFTTFSAFTGELFAAALQSQWKFVLGYLLTTQLVCFLAFAIGYSFSLAIQSPP